MCINKTGGTMLERIINRILDKLLSGRYCMTVCASITFVHMACHGMLPTATVLDIIKMVAIFYFMKKINKEN